MAGQLEATNLPSNPTRKYAAVTKQPTEVEKHTPNSGT
jgi:hypothetical protein